MVFFGRGRVGFRLIHAVLFLGATGLGTGCGGGAGAHGQTAASFAGNVHPLEVTNTTFAPEVVSLLQTREQTPERLGRLIGVVRYELARAALLFDSGHDEAALGA